MAQENRIYGHTQIDYYSVTRTNNASCFLGRTTPQYILSHPISYPEIIITSYQLKLIKMRAELTNVRSTLF